MPLTHFVDSVRRVCAGYPSSMAPSRVSLKVTTVPACNDGDQSASILIGSVVAKVVLGEVSEQSASDPPSPKPIASYPESSQVNEKSACDDDRTSAAGPTGSVISIADHPEPLGTSALPTVQSDVTSMDPGPVNTIVLTGETSPSLLTQLNETLPAPPAVVIRPWNSIFTGHTPLISAGSAVASTPTTRS